MLPDADIMLVEHLVPQSEQLLLGGLSQFHFSKQRQVHGRGHDHLGARKGIHGAAQRVLLYDKGFQLVLFGGECGRNTGWPCTDNDEVPGHAPLKSHIGHNVFNSLPALLNSILDQAHAPQLSGNVEAFHIGLERLTHMGQIDTPFFSANAQGNGLGWTGMKTGPMSDAMRGIDGGSFAVADAQNVFFRTCQDACPRFDAAVFVHHRMQRNRLIQPIFLSLRNFFFHPACFPPLLAEVNEHHHQTKQQHYGVDANLFYEQFVHQNIHLKLNTKVTAT